MRCLIHELRLFSLHTHDVLAARTKRLFVILAIPMIMGEVFVIQSTSVDVCIEMKYTKYQQTTNQMRKNGADLLEITVIVDAIR